MLPLNASGTVRRKVFVVANACIPSPLTNPHNPRSKYTREDTCFEMLFYERRNPPPLLMRDRLPSQTLFLKRFVYKFF